MFDEGLSWQKVWIEKITSLEAMQFSKELPDTRPLGLELVELRVVRVTFGMLRESGDCLEDGLQVKE